MTSSPCFAGENERVFYFCFDSRQFVVVNIPCKTFRGRAPPPTKIKKIHPQEWMLRREMMYSIRAEEEMVFKFLKFFFVFGTSHQISKSW